MAEVLLRAVDMTRERYMPCAHRSPVRIDIDSRSFCVSIEHAGTMGLRRK